MEGENIEQVDSFKYVTEYMLCTEDIVAVAKKASHKKTKSLPVPLYKHLRKRLAKLLAMGCGNVRSEKLDV